MLLTGTGGRSGCGIRERLRLGMWGRRIQVLTPDLRPCSFDTSSSIVLLGVSAAPAFCVGRQISRICNYARHRGVVS